ncbi:uncharacterized protein L201_002072 [Kwoniella dendrophila CBS 6074]|uniref:Uncharacterized protein n=1 Tax=Kwoniella dendrophila CBS 6074 TaxID=1295534 RepID=A0AAX4JQ61_9TREE
MDAFTAIFNNIAASAAQTSEAPRNEEAKGSNLGTPFLCVIA